MTSDCAYLKGVEFFGGIVDRFSDHCWEWMSPCEGWRALDVLGHVGAGVRFSTALLLNEKPDWQPAEPPGNAVGQEPIKWWIQLAGPAREALSGVDITRTVETPLGKREIGRSLSFPAVDLFVHGWDLARVVDVRVEIPGQIIEFAHALIDPLPVAEVRSSRVFAREQVIPISASPTDAFIAWTGRDPSWAMPAQI